MSPTCSGTPSPSARMSHTCRTPCSRRRVSRVRRSIIRTRNALSYTFPIVGHGWNSGDLSAVCGGVGWHMSVNDLLSVMAGFRRTNTIMSAATCSGDARRQVRDRRAGTDVPGVGLSEGRLLGRPGSATSNSRWSISCLARWRWRCWRIPRSARRSSRSRPGLPRATSPTSSRYLTARVSPTAQAADDQQRACSHRRRPEHPAAAAQLRGVSFVGSEKFRSCERRINRRG